MSFERGKGLFVEGVETNSIHPATMTLINKKPAEEVKGERWCIPLNPEVAKFPFLPGIVRTAGDGT